MASFFYGDTFYGFIFRILPLLGIVPKFGTVYIHLRRIFRRDVLARGARQPPRRGSNHRLFTLNYPHKILSGFRPHISRPKKLIPCRSCTWFYPLVDEW